MPVERKVRQIGLPTVETKRPISPGAEKWMGVEIPVLDHGFVYLVDYMGNDAAVEQAARVSYGSGTRSVNETEGLVRYLRRHKHTTPFEMVEFKFHAKMPIFVARQWIRHRTANINEYSARYSILDNEFYIPEPDILAAQSKKNRQGREEILDPQEAECVRQLLIEDAARNYEHYKYLLNDDGKGNPIDPERSMLARELARMDLSLNFYTQWYWKIDLHNLFHFLKLRMDPHAQHEIRVYADALAKIVEDSAPIAWKAFEDYELYAVTLTRPELAVLSQLLKGKVAFDRTEVLAVADAIGLTNRREREELVDKLASLDIVVEK